MTTKIVKDEGSQEAVEQLNFGLDYGFGADIIPNTLVEDELVETKVVEEAEKTDADKLQELREIIMPLLYNLRDSADTSDTIHWPGRKKQITGQINKINKLTGND